MIYRISIILYRYKYRIEKIDRYPAIGGKDIPFSDMVRVVACHAGDRGSNPVGPFPFRFTSLVQGWQLTGQYEY